MKNMVLSFAVLVLSLGIFAAAGPARSVPPHGPAAADSRLRCVKGLIGIEGVTAEQAILFVEDGFSCKPV